MAQQGSAGNVIAALSSFFIPGLGQLIQGRILAAILHFGVRAVLFITPIGWAFHLWSAISAARYKTTAVDRTPEPAPQGAAATVTNAPPIKVTPSRAIELERTHSQFESYSPAQKLVRTTFAPKRGEEWGTQQTLPSGLYRAIVLGAIGMDIYKRLRKIFGEILDDRKFQYAPQDNNPLLFAEWNDTISVSWHPTQELLVTRGRGGVTKLWDTSDGSLLTKRAIWHPNDGQNINWSYDGRLFMSGGQIFDGITGKLIKEWKWSLSHKYTAESYSKLRGTNNYSESTSHLSSSNNFSPWRPNSSQYFNEEFEKGIVLRGGHTSELEEALDCATSSQVSDFAWHPNGRFIAVAFKEENIRIIDLDEARLIDSLSVKQLVGWSPDGKILVVRKGKDEYLIWDALEAQEKPMPEEMKNELWFKRFFQNISADGLRYIEGANIYSVESGQLLATLPKPVTCAAWSPIDGSLLATCGGTETHIWRLQS